MKILLGFFLMFIVSCSGQALNDYKGEDPKLNLREFFNGKLHAQGIVQDRGGKVLKRFSVNILAEWKDNVCTLDEDFTYSDHTKSKRVWRLSEVSEKNYEGVAHDVIGVATGKVDGNAFYFQYQLDVPVGDGHYTITFKDWMYLLDSKTLMARSYMTKWGFNVGEVTLVMMKKD